MTLSLFTWQRSVIAGPLSQASALTALRIGLDSAQTTGREVVVNAENVAADLGCSVRTVWRRVNELVAEGWLVQTAKPTYGGADARGRRARYALSTPESCATPGVPVSDDSDLVACHTPAQGGTRPDASSANGPGGLAHDPASRVPNQAQSCATTPPADGTLLASDGSSNSSSSGDDVAVEILARKLRQTTALAGLRTDKLKPHQVSQITRLIETHGDQRLVDQALRGLRRDDPPLTIQAFLPAWSNMPAPGQHLALVKDPPCDLPGHSGTTKHCAQCASERLAAR